MPQGEAASSQPAAASPHLATVLRGRQARHRRTTRASEGAQKALPLAKLPSCPASAVGHVRLGRRVITFRTRPRSTLRKPRVKLLALASPYTAKAKSPLCPGRMGSGALDAGSPSPDSVPSGEDDIVCAPSKGCRGRTGAPDAAEAPGEGTCAAKGAQGAINGGLPNKDPTADIGTSASGTHHESGNLRRGTAVATCSEDAVLPVGLGDALQQADGKTAGAGLQSTVFRTTRSGRCYSILGSVGATVASLHRRNQSSPAATGGVGDMGCNADSAGAAASKCHGMLPSRQRGAAAQAGTGRRPPRSVSDTGAPVGHGDRSDTQPPSRDGKTARASPRPMAAAAAATGVALQGSPSQGAGVLGPEPGLGERGHAARGSVSSASAASSAGAAQHSPAGQALPAEELPAPRQPAGSPSTASFATHPRTGQLQTPSGSPGRAPGPSALHAPLPPGVSPATSGSGLEWSDVSAASWSQWRKVNGDWGIARMPAAVAVAEAQATPDNARPAPCMLQGTRLVPAPTHQPTARRDEETPRRDMFVRTMALGSFVPSSLTHPSADAAQVEAEGHGEGYGHGEAYPRHGRVGMSNLQQQRWAAADATFAPVQKAPGHDAAAPAAAHANPDGRGCPQDQGVPDACSPSQRLQPRERNLGPSSALGYNCRVANDDSSSHKGAPQRLHAGHPSSVSGLTMFWPSGVPGRMQDSVGAKADPHVPLGSRAIGKAGQALMGGGSVAAARALPPPPLFLGGASAYPGFAHQPKSRPASIPLPPALARALMPPAAISVAEAEVRQAPDVGEQHPAVADAEAANAMLACAGANPGRAGPAMLPQRSPQLGPSTSAIPVLPLHSQGKQQGQMPDGTRALSAFFPVLTRSSAQAQARPTDH